MVDSLKREFTHLVTFREKSAVIALSLTLLLVGCSFPSDSSTTNDSSNTSSVESNEPMEESPAAFYQNATLNREDDYENACKREMLPRGWCQFYGKVTNNDKIPLDFLAEIYAEDSEGRIYKSSDTFETTLNPGESGYPYFNFRAPENIHITKIYLVDVGGPISDIILSADVSIYT